MWYLSENDSRNVKVNINDSEIVDQIQFLILDVASCLLSIENLYLNNEI